MGKMPSTIGYIEVFMHAPIMMNLIISIKDFFLWYQGKYTEIIYVFLSSEETNSHFPN